jgi:hypothetical protein
MRWEDTDLDRLSEALHERIGTGRYRDAAMGSCPVDEGNATFAVYRIAVLLRRPEAAASGSGGSAHLHFINQMTGIFSRTPAN